MSNYSKRQQKVFDKVDTLYASSEREMGLWMWANHVQWVAEKVMVLAEKYEADQDLAVVGALLHDLGDVRYERTDEMHEPWGDEESVKILGEAGFSVDEISEVMEMIVAPHSCHPENLPATVEGKVLATADAMSHLQTDFFIQICWMNLPPWKKTIEEWKEWVAEKLERDYSVKIFFDDEREEVEPNYQAWKRIIKS